MRVRVRVGVRATREEGGRRGTVNEEVEVQRLVDLKLLGEGGGGGGGGGGGELGLGLGLACLVEGGGGEDAEEGEGHVVCGDELRVAEVNHAAVDIVDLVRVKGER